jgi:hypothetical protein
MREEKEVENLLKQYPDKDETSEYYRGVKNTLEWILEYNDG